jgi:hypothetical protein
MSHGPSARTVAVRRAILAVVQRASDPISTPEVLVQMSESAGCNSHLSKPICRFGGRCPAWCWYDPVYRQLRALAQMGLIEHLPRSPEKRCAHGRYVDAETDVVFNSVLDALEAS